MKILPHSHNALNLHISTFALNVNASFQGEQEPPNKPTAKALFPISKYPKGVTASKQTCPPVHAVGRALTALLGQLSAACARSQPARTVRRALLRPMDTP